MKDDRSIFTFILLGIITLGIYEIWYLHCLVKDVNELCEENGQKSSGVLVYLVLSLITCGLYGIFWWYRIADMLAIAGRKRGLDLSITGNYVLICFILNYFVCGIASYVGIHQVFEATNELASDYNAKLTYRPNHNSGDAGV